MRNELSQERFRRIVVAAALFSLLNAACAKPSAYKAPVSSSVTPVPSSSKPRRLI